MRVLLINHFPLLGSGSGVYVANVARELSEAGHAPVVLCPNISAPAEGELPFPVETITCPAPGTDAHGKDLTFPFPCFTRSHPKTSMR